MSKGEIRVSAKGHCDLSRVRTKDHTFYIGYEDGDGTIHLVPAVLVPARRVQLPVAGQGTVDKLEEAWRNNPFKE